MNRFRLIILLVLCPLFYTTSAPALEANAMPSDAAVQPAPDELISCSGIGLSMGIYCDWGGCMSLDGGFLAKGTCPEGPFDMAETEEMVFDEESWGRTRLTELAAEKDPDETIVLHAALPDDGFDFTTLAAVQDKVQTDLLINDRKESLVPLQEFAEDIVEDLGGIVHGRTWIVNGLIIEIPVSAVADLLGELLFVDLNPEGDSTEPTDANEGWGGLDITDGTLSDDLFDVGYSGESGGRTSSPDDNIKIGVMETYDKDGPINYLNCNHVGWDDYAGQSPPSRLIAARFCTWLTGTCYGTSTACSSSNLTHGTKVAWAATGSIEQGQDSNWPGYRTNEQRRRSGVAREVDLYYYYAPTSCDKLVALEQALTDGVDVLNMSWHG
ncbi:MAG: hypothetical protein ABIK09_09130 [Pseudomonadota bacterium]